MTDAVCRTREFVFLTKYEPHDTVSVALPRVNAFPETAGEVASSPSGPPSGQPGPGGAQVS